MTMLDEALKFAAKGVHVFPLQPGAKVPLKGSRGVKDASVDAVQIEAWWRVHPGANLGIACGPSGLVVLDIDRKNGVDGWRALDDAMRELGELPGPCKMVSTPSGGAHLYFRGPSDLRPSTGKLGPGLDVRAGNSYVVAPPSEIDGRAYTWDVANVATPELPATWVEALRVPKRELAPVVSAKPTKRARHYCLRAMQDEAYTLAETPHGERNERLWRAAAALGGLVHLGEIDQDDIEMALSWACSRWTERDPRKDRDTISRGLAFGIEHPRQWEEGG
jgi:hypothetical protein